MLQRVYSPPLRHTGTFWCTLGPSPRSASHARHVRMMPHTWIRRSPVLVDLSRWHQLTAMDLPLKERGHHIILGISGKAFEIHSGCSLWQSSSRSATCTEGRNHHHSDLSMALFLNLPYMQGASLPSRRRSCSCGCKGCRQRSE